MASHLALAMGYAPTDNIDALLFLRRRRALARDGGLNDPLDIAPGFILQHTKLMKMRIYGLPLRMEP